MKKSINSTVRSFYVNISMWAFFCIVILTYRLISTGSSPLERISSESKAALTRFVEPELVGLLFLACILLFCLAAFIGHKFGTPTGENGIRALLDQILFEAASVLLNFGSLLVAISWFSFDALNLVGGLASWCGWWLIKPREEVAIT